MIQIALNPRVVSIDWPGNNSANRMVRKPNSLESH